VSRRIEGEHPYLYLDGILMKRSWAAEVRNVSLLVASAVNSEDFERFWASVKEPRRIKLAGRRFCGTWSIAALKVFS
jgi:transposase-like protein